MGGKGCGAVAPLPTESAAMWGRMAPDELTEKLVRLPLEKWLGILEGMG